MIVANTITLLAEANKRLLVNLIFIVDLDGLFCTIFLLQLLR